MTRIENPRFHSAVLGKKSVLVAEVKSYTHAMETPKAC